jgi:hypothetical protein
LEPDFTQFDSKLDLAKTKNSINGIPQLQTTIIFSFHAFISGMNFLGKNLQLPIATVG